MIEIGIDPQVLSKNHRGVKVVAGPSITGIQRVIKSPLSDSVYTAEEIKKEALLLAHLSHPNIMKVANLRGDKSVLTAEYVQAGGHNLDSLIAFGKEDPRWQVTESQALQIGFQLASALDYLHDKGIVHLDIKPANVVVDYTRGALRPGAVTLVDFESAVDINTSSQSVPTMTTTGYGSTDTTISKYSDYQSFGVVLFELLTGKHPSITHRLATDPMSMRNFRLISDEWSNEFITILSGIKRESNYPLS